MFLEGNSNEAFFIGFKMLKLKFKLKLITIAASRKANFSVLKGKIASFVPYHEQSSYRL